jgi:DNA-binding MarR family transcriptional regulator
MQETVELMGGARDIARLRLAILRLARRMKQTTASRFSPSQQSILAILDHYGPMSPGRLAEIEAVQPPSITRILGQLEDAGYVSRAPLKNNLRQVEVRLTEAGKLAAIEVHSGRDEWLASALGELSPDDQCTLLGAISSLELLVENANYAKE